MDVSEKASGRWSGTWCLLLTFPELFRLAVAYQFRAPYQDLLSKNNYKWFLGCLARAGGFSPCARALLVELLPLQTEEAGSRERAFLMGKGDAGAERRKHTADSRAYCVPISSSIPSRILPQGLCGPIACPFPPASQAGSYLRAFAQATSSTSYTLALNLSMAAYMSLQPS